jgi:hypothetical protein
LKDSANNPLVTTIEKYGPNATIVQGELGRVYGIPVVISEYVREDLNAVGLYDGSDVTRTVMILVNRKGYAIGDRRTLKVKVAESVQTDQQILVCTMRKAFSPIYAASDPSVAIAYNISS